MLRRGEPGGGALQGVGFADTIDQDLPHKPGGDVVEMGAVGTIGLILGDEAEEGFVDEFGGAPFGGGEARRRSGSDYYPLGE